MVLLGVFQKMLNTGGGGGSTSDWSLAHTSKTYHLPFKTILLTKGGGQILWKILILGFLVFIPQKNPILTP